MKVHQLNKLPKTGLNWLKSGNFYVGSTQPKKFEDKDLVSLLNQNSAQTKKRIYKILKSDSSRHKKMSLHAIKWFKKKENEYHMN